MRHELFASMKEQLNPSLQTQAELKEALAHTNAKAGRSRWKPAVAVAACLAVTLCAIPISQARLFTTPHRPAQHGYITLDQPFAPIEAQKQSIDGGTGTGASTTLPGGAYVGDVPVQMGAELYDNLLRGMGLWGETAPDYPAWYGGAYIGQDGHLNVLLVDSENPGDKSLELQVLEWTGNTGVAFSSAKYSLAHLHELRVSVSAVIDRYDGFATWAVNEVENRIDLDVSTPLSNELLAELAKLDPDDDAISIRVYEGSVLELQQKGPLPGGVTTPAEQPVPVAIGDDVDGNPNGYHYDKQPIELPIPEPLDETGLPAHYDLLPARDGTD